MELIDKTKLLTEIKRRILEDYNTGDKEKDAVAQGAIASLKYYIEDTLEVKEVEEEPSDDLEEEIDKELHENWYGEYIDLDKFRESANHFYELGLKAQKGE